MGAELFELELFGEGIERRYRQMRPEVEAMPWGTFDTKGLSPQSLIIARKQWTLAAFQEHRTGIACCAALKALMECRAPLDLIALASRFPLDELVHVELCARMAMELGGGTEVQHDPDELIVEAPEGLTPVMRAADMIVRFFCVGEALSIPLLRATWKASNHPLPRAVLGRIVKDEAAHGTFGFAFLDWALPQLSEADKDHLGKACDRTMRVIMRNWDKIRANRSADYDERVGDALGWMQTGAYLALADKSMQKRVRQPLLEHGIPITA